MFRVCSVLKKMPPNECSSGDSVSAVDEIEKKEFKTKIVVKNVIFAVYAHLSMLYGVHLAFTSASWKTVLLMHIYGIIGGLGVTAGAHRLWSHRSYKAKLPLRILLCIFNCICAQNHIYEWSRNHRVHHKYTETDADPYSIKRGFFFAHMGWLLCRKHPDVMEKGKNVFLDDLLADPVVRFQKKFFYPLVLFFAFYLPTMIPVWLWDESIWNSFFTVAMARWVLTLNFTFLVNSAAHMFGDKPFDKRIEACDNPVVSLLSIGEGWHNYHHVFPWDYSASELGYSLNFTKIFIDFMAMIGQAYDLKTANPKLVEKTKLKTGDGSRLKSS